MRIHLEGMGLQGALLAHRLHQYGVPFTWHDIDAKHTAWKASTGAIYPADSTNHGPDRETWKVWRSWHAAGQFDRSHLERSSGLVFCTKQPPHKGAYEFQELGDGLRRGLEPSFHFNAQTFVPAMRSKFAPFKTMIPQINVDRYVITHGWGKRLDRAYWGWTRLVQLNFSGLQVGGERPAFYFRPNRYLMAYAYPVPGTPWYYAGSSIIQQRVGKFRDLEVPGKYAKWKENFESIAQGKVVISQEGDYLTGWRPAASPEDEAWVRVGRANVITLRPLWNSGIRHFPAQWQGLAPLLGLVP